MPQPGFFDLDERYAKLNERDPLVKLNQIIDWEAFREPLSVLRNKPRKSQAGRKPYDVVLMFKILVLQHLYKELAALGLRSHIHKKGQRNKPLSEAQQRANTRKSKVRVRVEHVFGSMTNEQGGWYFRVIGLARTATKIGLMNLVYNMRRLVQIDKLRAPSGILDNTSSLDMGVQIGPDPLAGMIGVSSDDRGDLALAPYYTARDDWVTGLHIVNTSDRTQMVKAAFPPRHGRPGRARWR